MRKRLFTGDGDAASAVREMERVCRLRDLLSSPRLEALVSRMDSLPSLPSLYVRLVEELQSPEVSTQRLGEIISQDFGMTARVLQLVNSAYFGLTRRVASAERAVVLLGIEIVKGLLLLVHVLSQLDPEKKGGFPFDTLWRHSMACAGSARRIAEAQRLEKSAADEATTAGFLHDVGKLVLSANFPQEYRDTIASRSRHQPLWEAEETRFGVTHGELGAYLLDRWGLPEAVVEAVAYHHFPSRCVHRSLSPLTIVHVADFLENARGCPETEALPVELDEAYLAGLEPWGFSLETLVPEA